MSGLKRRSSRFAPVFCIASALIGLIPGLFLLADARGGTLPPCASITPAPEFKTSIDFPDDPFRVEGAAFGEPGWIKFTIPLCDPLDVYFHDGNAFLFHYDFITSRLDPYLGLSLQAFQDISLRATGQELALGAIVLPPLVGSPPEPAFPEYGIQLVRLDPYDSQTALDYINLVRSRVVADPSVQVFYFPTFEQRAAAEADAAFFAANNVQVGSPARWATGNSCYSLGWTLGELKFFPADQIDAAFLSGALRPGDILLTDGVPSDMPLVAGLLTTTPATPNSHISILANTFRVPFVFLGDDDDAARVQSLIGQNVVLRAQPPSPFAFFGDDRCDLRIIDIEDTLAPQQINALLALKQPPALDISPIEPFGAFSASTDGLAPVDIRFFGGKAANFGFLRRSIPAGSPVSLGVSFDLWQGFLDQVMLSGMTLREEIAALLGGYTFPPTNMLALSNDLDAIRDMIKDDAVTQFTPAQETTVLSLLLDPQFGFDPLQKLRFRSSTNVEDSEQFTGAGLYDSFSGCLADDLDADAIGPSLCDPGENKERGVFRAIRKVFASFYNDNAFLERLRHGVQPDDVGMAVLVHHSFPDPIELANGVATYTRQSSLSDEVDLVTQLGAVSVTNPDGTASPEVVESFIISSSGSFSVTLRQSSSLVLLGDHVMNWEQDYRDLVEMLIDAADRFELETGKTRFVLDFEYKKMAPGGAVIPTGGMVIKQIREIPQPDTTPNIVPFLVNEPTEYVLEQGNYVSGVFTNHRLKSRLRLSTQNMFLDPVILPNQTIYDQVEIEFFDGCRTATLSGDITSFPNASHGYDAQLATTSDHWRLAEIGNPRDVTLRTMDVGVLVSQAESPVQILPDFGFPPGEVLITVVHDQPVTVFAGFPPMPTMVTEESASFVSAVPGLFEEFREQNVDTGDGVTMTVPYYLTSHESVCAGCIFHLSRWGDQTVISGLTSEPLVLKDYFAQTYAAGQHNFTEDFLFEPRLDPNVSASQLAELDAQNIGLIHLRKDISGSHIVTYYATECVPVPCACQADVNEDGVVNGVDVALFSECLLGEAPIGVPCTCADMNGNGQPFDDVPAFVSALLANDGCN
ncbi:MAG: dockerin type I domain-containing protein [Phycisphaerales bacterium]|nr:dockerin type I domain-containing protein [Phycisphaerales bacterium]